MTDPFGIFSAKIASMIGGLFGGAAILTFIRPKNISEAFTRGGVSVGSALIFGIPILDFLQIENTWDTQLVSGFCIGFLAYSILGMIANFLDKRKNSDIIDVAGEISDKFRNK